MRMAGIYVLHARMDSTGFKVQRMSLAIVRTVMRKCQGVRDVTQHLVVFDVKMDW